MARAALENRAQAMVMAFIDDDARVERMRRMRQMKQPISIPNDHKFVDMESHSPDIADEGFRIAQSLIINDFKVQVTPTKFGVQKYEKNADDRGRWAKSFLHTAGSKHNGEETAYAVTDACVNDGGGWSKLIYSPQDWEVRDSVDPANYASSQDYLDAVDDASKTDVPMRWIPVDTLTAYPVFANGRLVQMYEITERPAWQVLQEFGIGWDRGRLIGEPLSVTAGAWSVEGNPPPSKLRVIEHWTEHIYEVCVSSGAADNNQYSYWLQAPVAHGLPRVPYFYTPGLMLNWWRGRKAALSAGELKSWLVEYKDYLRTLQANAAARDVFTTLHRERPRDGEQLIGEDGTPITETDYEMGVVMEGAPGEKITAIQFPDVSPNLQAEMKAVEMDIERLMTPRVRSDIGGAGMEGAGFAISQVIAEAKVQHATFARHIEGTLREVVQLAWWMIEHIVKDVVYVESDGGNGYIGLGPTDLENHVGLHVHLDPEQPSTKLIEQRYWNERIASGTAEPVMAIKALGDDPSEVEFMQTVRLMKQTDWFTALYQQEVSQALGAGDIVAKAFQARQVAESGGQRGGAPGAPGAMGSQIVPDMGNQALRSTVGSNPGAGPGNSPNMNTSPGAVVPTAGGAAGARLG